eukprot:3935925-Rhodomonas_salina.4
MKQERPGLASPSFKTEDAPDGDGSRLHYWSFRPGFASLVQGMVKACGPVLFEQETVIEELRSSEAAGSNYVLFRVTTTPVSAYQAFLNPLLQMCYN